MEFPKRVRIEVQMSASSVGVSDGSSIFMPSMLMELNKNLEGFYYTLAATFVTSFPILPLI